MDEQNEKKRTVGVSLSPTLQRAAKERARALGLNFSQYVGLCVEAELRGRVPSLFAGEAMPGAQGAYGAGGPGGARGESDGPGGPGEDAIDLDEAIERGGQYGAMKARSIEFEDDIREILEAAELPFDQAEKVGTLRADFVVRLVDPETDRARNVVLECRYNVRNRYEVTLGQAIILQSQPGVDRVVLVVPYLKNFNPALRETFRAQGVEVATPDTLLEVLEGEL